MAAAAAKARARKRRGGETASQKFVFNFSGTVLFYSLSPHTLRRTCAASQAIFYIINVALPAARRTSMRFPVHARHPYSRPRVIRDARARAKNASHSLLSIVLSRPRGGREGDANDGQKGEGIIKMYVRTKIAVAAVGTEILGWTP